VIPSETEAPLLHAAFEDAICTFQSPSNVRSRRRVAATVLASNKRWMAEIDLRKCPMTCPRCLDGGTVPHLVPS